MLLIIVTEFVFLPKNIVGDVMFGLITTSLVLAAVLIVLGKKGEKKRELERLRRVSATIGQEAKSEFARQQAVMWASLFDETYKKYPSPDLLRLKINELDKQPNQMEKDGFVFDWDVREWVKRATNTKESDNP